MQSVYPEYLLRYTAIDQTHTEANQPRTEWDETCRFSQGPKTTLLQLPAHGPPAHSCSFEPYSIDAVAYSLYTAGHCQTASAQDRRSKCHQIHTESNSQLSVFDPNRRAATSLDTPLPYNVEEDSCSTIDAESQQRQHPQTQFRRTSSHDTTLLRHKGPDTHSQSLSPATQLLKEHLRGLNKEYHARIREELARQRRCINFTCGQRLNEEVPAYPINRRYDNVGLSTSNCEAQYLERDTEGWYCSAFFPEENENPSRGQYDSWESMGYCARCLEEQGRKRKYLAETADPFS